MRVSVFGLGYVGSVSAASFAADGHEVIGVDVNTDKVATVNAGRSPIVEPGLDDLLQRAVSEGRLRATTSTADAIADSDVSLLCVGTPSRKNGSLDLTYLERVSEQIGAALKSKANYHVVVVRSTVLPGTTHEKVIPALEREIGNLCKRVGVDSHEVMDIFCRDEKLNLSPYYLKPGFAFGGSCLPKDVRALQYRAKEVDVELPVISQILPSNKLQIQQAFDQIMETGKKKIGLLGFSFKAGTDDLRESPIVILAEQLLGKGRELCIYDKNVFLAKLVGANKEYIEKQIPHLSSLLCNTIDDLIDKSEVIVVGNQAPEFAEALTRARADQIIVDLVRLPIYASLLQADYRGICW